MAKKDSSNTLPSIFDEFFEDTSRFVERFFPREFYAPTRIKWPDTFSYGVPEVKETDENITYRFNIPDQDKKDIKINVNEGTLEVLVKKETKEETQSNKAAGASSDEKEGKGDDAKYMTRSFSSRSYNYCRTLPEYADENSINATYKDNILEIVVKKNPDYNKEKSRTIEVK